MKEKVIVMGIHVKEYDNKSTCNFLRFFLKVKESILKVHLHWNTAITFFKLFKHIHVHVDSHIVQLQWCNTESTCLNRPVS